MTPEEETQYKEQKREKKYHKLRWSKIEKLYRTRSRFTNPKLMNNKIPLSLVLKIKLKYSCFGRFMKTFNEDNSQNFFIHDNNIDIEKWNKMQHTTVDTQEWDYNHNFSEDLFQLLEKAVDTEKCIDYEYLYKNLSNLCLSDSQINVFDSLKDYENLKFLVVAGNWIKKIKGRNLPSSLEFFECFLNEIDDFRLFCKNCPLNIKHLGFSRNLINDNSNCHLLSSSGRFLQLHSLDLSDNNIQNLTEFLQQLNDLPRLTSLSLEGNPCYTCLTYKENVLDNFPKLLYLDNTKIIPEDKNIKMNKETKDNSKVGGLVFTCYRLISVPQPPKGKVIHNYHLEVELPLLEEIKIPVEEPIEEPKPEPEIEKTEVPPVDTDKGKEKKKGKKEEAKESKKEKKDKKKDAKDAIPAAINGAGIYALPDEHATEIAKKIQNKNFKTEAREWAKVIKFNAPAFIADCPENNLNLLRDTFRSRVKINVVYTQKFKPKEKKKPKPKEKGKKNEVIIEEETPQEIILKKSTFATFYCDLHTVNWSDEYVDFIWADIPTLNNIAVPAAGNLKAEIYTEKGKKGKGASEKTKKGDRGSKKTDNAEKTVPLPKYTLPTILTCHFGFGLNRHGLSEEIIPLKEPKKGKGK